MRMESNLQQPAECWTLVVDRGEKFSENSGEIGRACNQEGDVGIS
jgi:hypothetical protein